MRSLSFGQFRLCAITSLVCLSMLSIGCQTPNAVNRAGLNDQPLPLTPEQAANGQAINGQTVNGQTVNGQATNGQPGFAPSATVNPAGPQSEPVLTNHPLQAAEAGALNSSNQNQFVVQFFHDGELSKPQYLPWEKRVHVNEVLKTVQADKVYRNLVVHVERKTDLSSRKVQLKTERYNHRTNQVSLLTDYAIHPGDRVVIEAADLDNVFNAMVTGVSDKLNGR